MVMMPLCVCVCVHAKCISDIAAAATVMIILTSVSTEALLLHTNIHTQQSGDIEEGIHGATEPALIKVTKPGTALDHTTHGSVPVCTVHACICTYKRTASRNICGL